MNDTYEEEINLKDLLFFILRKWPLIVSISIAFTVLAGGYKLISYKNTDDMAELREIYENERKQYQQTLAGYLKNIENLSADIEYEESYQKSSILFQIDPYKKQLASADIFITMDYSKLQDGVNIVSIDPADSVLKAYASAIIKGGFLLPLAEETGTDINYLKELIRVSPDYNGNMLSISVTHTDQSSSEKILDLILETANAIKPEIQKELGQHSTIVMNKNTDVVIDMELAKSLKDKAANLTYLYTSLSETQKSLMDLTEPKEPLVLSENGILKAGMKYGFLGGIFSVFLAVFLISISFLSNNTLYSENELKDKFGIRILGAFFRMRKKAVFPVIDDYLDRLEGKRKKTDQEVYEIIAANIKNFMEGDSKILLTGTINEMILNDLKDRLQDNLCEHQLEVIPDINENPKALKALQEYDNVVLVEERGVSKFSQVTSEIEMVHDLKKHVIGCILF